MVFAYSAIAWRWIFDTICQALTCHAMLYVSMIKWKRIPKGQPKMNNPEKLAAYGTQDEEKQYTNTTQYVSDTTMRKQTQIP